MERPTSTEWGFDSIRTVDSQRADQLEKARSSGKLIDTLELSLRQAITADDINIVIDSIDNKFEECRVTVQFKIDKDIYDWFFNARTGCRGQYWVSEEAGIEFNKNITKFLSDVLRDVLPDELEVRKIHVDFPEGSREEKYVGDMLVTKDFVLTSLEPEESKIWICERLYSRDENSVQNIGFSVLSEAERDMGKLGIPKWKNTVNPKTGEVDEGLRAPYPIPEYSWLDLKGGFVSKSGRVEQKKGQKGRAKSLHEYGWT